MAAKFALSVRAREQLLDIYVFTAQNFGDYQAEAYHAGFERTFDLIANFPLIGVAVDDLAPGYKRFRFQAHHIFYTLEATGFSSERSFMPPCRSGPDCSNDARKNERA